MFIKSKNSNEKLIRKSKYWNAKWYQKTYLDSCDIEPIEHFLKYGWKRGYKPSQDFDMCGYLKFYVDVQASGINPLVHYEKYGKYEHRFVSDFEYNTIKNSAYFDEVWYQKTYSITTDCVKHYLEKGWKLGYNPSEKFSTLSYLALNYDVRKEDTNPLLHYERFGHNENTMRIFKDSVDSSIGEKKLKKYYSIQDERIEKNFSCDIKKLILFLVPAVDEVCGGLMSICSIAHVTKSLIDIHNSEVMLATVPTINTFTNYTSFETEFDIYRFEQVFDYFTSLEEVLIHIPENFIIPFVIKISVKNITALQKIKKVRINILNQNNLLMPRPYDVEFFLRKICSDLTMTVAHKQYCTPQMRTSYNMPVHLFSASNLVEYYYTPYINKEDLLVYSPDSNPYKNQILEKIKKELPDLKLLEIHDLSYIQYRKIISRAKWMITFGEGLDGYFVESIRSGAIAFAGYNNVFFDESFSNVPNVYKGFPEMLNHIVDDIKYLDTPSLYTQLNNELKKIDAQEYDDQKYIKNIRQYYLEKYDYPLNEIIVKRRKRIERQPKVSIAMATYNGEKYILKQLLSLVHLKYPNYEIVISDDGSTDNTIQIIKSMQKKYPIILVHNKGKHGLNENFHNAIKHTSGEYIALCDQDDIWLSDKLDNLLERIDNFDIIYGNVKVIDSNDKNHPWPIMHDAYENSKHRYYQFRDFVYENLMLGCASLIRRDLIKAYLPIPAGVIYHDWWFVLNAIKNGRGICYIDVPVIKYRQHDSNTAKMTFEKVDFYKNKARFDKVILDKFGSQLTENERNYIESDYYWNVFREAFRFRAPNYLNEFFDSNRLSFDKTALSSILEIEQMEAYNEA